MILLLVCAVISYNPKLDYRLPEIYQNLMKIAFLHLFSIFWGIFDDFSKLQGPMSTSETRSVTNLYNPQWAKVV